MCIAKLSNMRSTIGSVVVVHTVVLCYSTFVIMKEPGSPVVTWALLCYMLCYADWFARNEKKSNYTSVSQLPNPVIQGKINEQNINRDEKKIWNHSPSFFLSHTLTRTSALQVPSWHLNTACLFTRHVNAQTYIGLLIKADNSITHYKSKPFKLTHKRA